MHKRSLARTLLASVACCSCWALQNAFLGQRAGNGLHFWRSGFRRFDPCRHRCPLSWQASLRGSLRCVGRAATSSASLVHVLAELETELSLLTDNIEELHTVFEAARSWHSDSDEETRLALCKLLSNLHARRADELAPQSVGPISAVTLGHDSGHEIALLGSMHSTYCFSGRDFEKPVPSAIRDTIEGLAPELIVLEMDEERARNPQLIPEELQSEAEFIARDREPELGEWIFVGDDVFRDAIVDNDEGVPSMQEMRRKLCYVYDESSDSRLFDNACQLQGYEAAMGGDLGLDHRAAVEAASIVCAPVLLADVPETSIASKSGLAKIRAAFAARRAGMQAFLGDEELYMRFETAKRQLLQGTMQTRGGGDLDLLGHALSLLEPLGAAYETMDEALTEIRDPYIASAFSEPDALRLLRGGTSDEPSLAVAVLGASHVANVAALLAAKGYKALPEPSRGWPPICPL